MFEINPESFIENPFEIVSDETDEIRDTEDVDMETVEVSPEELKQYARHLLTESEMMDTFEWYERLKMRSAEIKHQLSAMQILKVS